MLGRSERSVADREHVRAALSQLADIGVSQRMEAHSWQLLVHDQPRPFPA